RDLKKKGDFGLGTFDALDGEMIVLAGAVYQAGADGSVRPAKDDMRTPFAVVTSFKPGKILRLEEQPDMEGLQAVLDKAMRSQNLPYAVKIEGVFTRVHARSVPAQKKPYPRLAEVTGNQPEFEYRAVRGTMVGFRLPRSMEGINLAGYHFHFLTDDRKSGGHVLDCALAGGQAEIAELHRLDLNLPRSGAFLEAASAGANQAEAKRVESAAGKHITPDGKK
ncbi:MAG: acetolactate decarboxylase, partial [Syntrophales bacterium]|nr:acetolactate decarboxylase [Syntrophales bacterium]